MRRVSSHPFLVAALVLALDVPARAEDAPGAIELDRVAVRLVAPETGGAARPRFFTEREVAFFTRVEALLEQTSLEPNEYPERYVRAAVDRLVARTMLASLMIQRGVEPPDLPRQAHEARAELDARLGPGVLADAMKKEGIDDEELLALLRDQVRATYYVDRMISPILVVTEDALHEAYRGMIHPFRKDKLEDVRAKLRRWIVTERLRAAEIEFLQGARARIKITTVRDLRDGARESPRQPSPRSVDLPRPEP